MTTDLAVVQQFHNTLDLPERDRGAAEAVAAGLLDAKFGNTCRACRSAWQQFRTWAEAGGHPALPAAPQAVALYMRVDSGRGQNRTLRLLSAFWPPVFAGEQDVGPPKGWDVGQELGLDRQAGVFPLFDRFAEMGGISAPIGFGKET